jgi:hypothetical protein
MACSYFNQAGLLTSSNTGRQVKFLFFSAKSTLRRSISDCEREKGFFDSLG